MSEPSHDWLDALPLAARLIDAEFHIHFANGSAQSLNKNFSDELRAAITRAFSEQRGTRLDHCWVAPYGNHALVLDDIDPSSADYTQLSSTMAAMLAHEIRNPLLSIKGAAQLLADTANADDKPLTELITREVERVDQLIGTLDPLSKQPVNHGTLNLHELCEHAALATATAFPKPIAITKDYDPSLPEISGDRDALTQALVNLLKNAVESSQEMPQPRVVLATRYVSDARRNEAGQKLPLAISITDNGRGVPPHFVPRLFAPFSTTKVSGKGLGLAIVARIVAEHGGVVAHDVPPAGGARFTIYLPSA